MKLKSILGAAAALAACGALIAQPSEYFLWKHKTSGKTVCDVAAPDANYLKTAGPFEDPNCKFKLPQ